MISISNLPFSNRILFYDVEIMWIIQEHYFCCINIGRIGKNVILFWSFFFWFYSGISKFGLNRPIGYGDTKFVEKICSILYDAYLFKNYRKDPKKLARKIVLFFDSTYLYQIMWNFLSTGWKVANVRYIPPFRPLFMAPASVRVWISRGAIYLLNK